MAPVWLRYRLFLLWYADLARFVLPGLIGFLTKSNEGQTLCSFPPAFSFTQFPPEGWRTVRLKILVMVNFYGIVLYHYNIAAR